MQDQYMLIAIEQAKNALNNDEVPVGAVIVDSITGVILARSANKTEQSNDPTAHAEMNVIRDACNIKKSNRLIDCDLYVTLEPCPMCAHAISAARIRRLYFGAYNPKGGGVEHGPRIYDFGSCNHKPQVYGGMCESICSKLLKVYFSGKRYKDY
jgi:tRNA(adenine34) deaminase